MKDYPSYTVAIRTLGKAGDKYLTTLRSSRDQSLPPAAIFVYIPEGYPLPAETIGTEKYVRCPKGMVTQRSLSFEEITTDWILFLDDDMYLPPDAVRMFFDAQAMYDADCVTANVFPNHARSLVKKIVAACAVGELPHYDDRWAFKIRRSSCYSYHNHPRGVMPSQSGSFNCLLVRKSAYQTIHYEDERWLDRVGYAFGDDQLFYYKLYRYGFKVLVHYASGVRHLDAGTGGRGSTKVAGKTRYLLWWRTQYSCASSSWKRVQCLMAFLLRQGVTLSAYALFSLMQRDRGKLVGYCTGLKEGYRFSQSPEAKKIPSYLKYKE